MVLGSALAALAAARARFVIPCAACFGAFVATFFTASFAGLFTASFAGLFTASFAGLFAASLAAAATPGPESAAAAFLAVGR
jgi:hypothetical protein